MAQLAIIGAGIGGLAAALFSARRGHEVELFERDAALDGDVEALFAKTPRRGVAQWRQPHNFLALSRHVLVEEAPDILAALHDAGCGEAAMAGLAPGDRGALYHSTVARRITYETVLRNAARAESRVRFHDATTVQGLSFTPMEDRPRVTGIRTEAGDVFAADLTVDASGRWTQAASWLAEIGARPLRETAQATPFYYLTRWYRLKPGRSFPDAETGVRDLFPFGGAVAFPADSGWFSLTLILSTHDPLRGAARDGKAFDAVMAALPNLAPWIAAGEAVGAPQTMGRLGNQYRRLVDETGPIASGFVLLGDAAIHTNPTLGRGASLAMAHARRLAETAGRAATDPAGFVADFDDWTDRNLGCWFASQVANDATRMAEMAASIAGLPVEPPTPDAQFMAAVAALGRTDPAVAEAMNRRVHLLAGPDDLMEDAALAARIRAAPQAASPPARTLFSRAEFAALLAL